MLVARRSVVIRTVIRVFVLQAGLVRHMVQRAELGLVAPLALEAGLIYPVRERVQNSKVWEIMGAHTCPCELKEIDMNISPKNIAASKISLIGLGVVLVMVCCTLLISVIPTLAHAQCTNISTCIKEGEEKDPQVDESTLTSDKLCRGTGTQVTCDQDHPEAGLATQSITCSADSCSFCISVICTAPCPVGFVVTSWSCGTASNVAAIIHGDRASCYNSAGGSVEGHGICTKKDP